MMGVPVAPQLWKEEAKLKREEENETGIRSLHRPVVLLREPVFGVRSHCSFRRASAAATAATLGFDSDGQRATGK